MKKMPVLYISNHSSQKTTQADGVIIGAKGIGETLLTHNQIQQIFEYLPFNQVQSEQQIEAFIRQAFKESQYVEFEEIKNGNYILD